LTKDPLPIFGAAALLTVMAIIKPKVSGNAHVKQGGKSQGGKSGRKGGFGGGKGGGFGGKGAAKGGGGGGQWMFIPAGHQMQQSFAPQQSFGKGGQRFGGKGGGRAAWAPAAPVMAFSKGGFGKGKGGGKGHRDQDPKQKKALDKLGKIDAENKVWVGGLPKDTKRGALFAHFKDSVKPHLFELMSKGTACVAFKTPEDAQLAIDTFNGSDLDGSSIQVDVWTKKEKTERPEKKQGSVIKTSFLKGKKGNKDKPGDNKKKSPMSLKIKAVDHSLKVWVGGLTESTTWKQLKQHFVDSGCEADMCDLMKTGTACVTFKTEDEATTAVGTVNGTELDDSTLQVDVWTRPERREKKKKDEEQE